MNHTVIRDRCSCKRSSLEFNLIYYAVITGNRKNILLCIYIVSVFLIRYFKIIRQLTLFPSVKLVSKN